jgi:hypothetical protein
VIIKPARDEDELEEQIEGLNLEDLIGIPDDNSPVIEIDPEVSDYEPIQYRLISDPDEKDSLIKRISKRTTEDVESSVEVDEDEEIN